VGEYFLEKLVELGSRFEGFVTNARGKGLMCAFDLPDGDKRGEFLSKAKEFGMLGLGCGERTIRFRPPLNITKEEVDEANDLVVKTLDAIKG
jgi:L-lysine 6-transaminase